MASKNLRLASKPQDFRPSKDYLSALKAFWEGRPRTCIERLTTLLSLEDQSRPSAEISALYRLWIEVLAYLNESDSLRVLLDHFSFQMNQSQELFHSMAAMKGLIHFELDEME